MRYLKLFEEYEKEIPRHLYDAWKDSGLEVTAGPGGGQQCTWMESTVDKGLCIVSDCSGNCRYNGPDHNSIIKWIREQGYRPEVIAGDEEVEGDRPGQTVTIPVVRFYLVKDEALRGQRTGRKFDF